MAIKPIQGHYRAAIQDNSTAEKMRAAIMAI